ncbi:hypothetical protein SOPP22_08075 [Shewanella sp. OPT22]|nr:hypothetical protein SOPP22_08075 [Shewanella sp. OPT22]
MSSRVVRQKYSALFFSSIFSCVITAAELQPTPSDMALIDEERIQYWLKKRGSLSQEASVEDRDAAIRRYLNEENALKSNKIIDDLPEPYKHKRGINKSVQNTSGVGASNASTSQVTTVKVLAILIDFPDYRYDGGQIGRNDTQMYYSSYPASHYTSMMFSKTGYRGPSGQTLRSVYQHYNMASGGTFKFTGTVKGWFRAENDAAYYGAPNGSSNDSRVPDLVFEAASQAAAAMSASELAEYDREDPYDIDRDGNYSEPDGIIDHTMIYHSSIGQEAGGGDLGVNAIWSHRFVVQGSSRGKPLPGTSKKVYNYTIQSIDATVGLAAHEFGHELGLVDEYDTSGSTSIVGAPIGYWSLMGQGTWTGNPQGTAPTGFSPLARNKLQEKFQGNWVREQEIDFSSLSETAMDFVLNEAVNTSEVNQLSITLPLVNGESKPRKYLIQLRSKTGIDVGLSTRKYEPGVLIWQQDTNQTNNRVQDRPGKPMIGVIDADQNLIGNDKTRVQVRDAAFSLYDQSSYIRDQHLSHKSNFRDSESYSASSKPQAGISLVNHGLNISVVEQATDNSTARLRIIREGVTNEDGYRASISSVPQTDGAIAFTANVSGGSGGYSYQWDFGDGNTSSEVSPTHVYTSDGSYTVSVTITDSNNDSINVSRTVTVSSNPSQPDSENDVKSSSSSGGAVNIFYLLFMLIMRKRVLVK